MNTRRLVMDARAQVWPWCSVMLAVVFVWLPSPGSLSLWNAALLGFWFGVPLLATLVLGREFQYGTWAVLLSQPVDRRTIWLEKTALIGISTISVVLLYAVLLPRPMRTEGTIVIGVLWALISTSSAVFWTLTARSTMGGFVLVNSQLILMVLLNSGNLDGKHDFLALPEKVSTIGISVVTGYAVLMLWLGRKKLLGFQVTGSGATGERFNSDPGRWTRVRRVFRCSPAELRLNLFRKEIHLLWPLWLSTGMTLGFVLLLIPFSRMADKAYSNRITEFGLIVVVLYSVLAALLAGTLSIGEERAWGTLSFERTQPVSIVEQWRIKLLTGLSSSLICTFLVYRVARFLIGQNFLEEAGFAPGSWVGIAEVYVAVVTFAAFWCASAFPGTVRAVTWSIPVVVVIGLAFAAGEYASHEGFYKSQVLGWVITKVHPFPFDFAAHGIPAENLLFIAIPLALFLVVSGVQSFRLFRAEPNDRALPVVRYLAVLTAIAFVGGFSQQVPNTVAMRTYMDLHAVLEEATRAANTSEFDLDSVGPTGLTLSVEDLARNNRLSALTRSWLARSSIHLVPREFTFPQPNRGLPVQRVFHYQAIMTVDLEGAWSCDIAIPRQLYLVYYCHSPAGTLGFQLLPMNPRSSLEATNGS